jgi:hypothetical protein
MRSLQELNREVNGLILRVRALEDPGSVYQYKAEWESPQPQVGLIKAADSESLGQKIERLIAYFEKRAKENYKRARNLENKASTSLQHLEVCAQTERSGYYFSGKADSYERAAEKVQEILRDPVDPLVPQTCTRKAPHVCTENGPCNGYPAMFGGDTCKAPQSGTYTGYLQWEQAKPVEKWITEFRIKSHHSNTWHPSQDKGLCDIFPSKEAAQAVVDKEAPKLKNIVRRVRRLIEICKGDS